MLFLGGKPKTLEVFESLRDKVTLFRRLDDYFKLAEIARTVESVVVVGGGFLGSELACALAAWAPQPNLEVIQIFPEHGNMAKVSSNLSSSTHKLEFSCSNYIFGRLLNANLFSRFCRNIYPNGQPRKFVLKELKSFPTRTSNLLNSIRKQTRWS